MTLKQLLHRCLSTVVELVDYLLGVWSVCQYELLIAVYSSSPLQVSRQHTCLLTCCTQHHTTLVICGAPRQYRLTVVGFLQQKELSRDDYCSSVIMFACFERCRLILSVVQTQDLTNHLVKHAYINPLCKCIYVSQQACNQPSLCHDHRTYKPKNRRDQAHVARTIE